MADVRLTATNPDDSTVVPVACNTKGEILLESPPEFDGNLDGDLTVTGSGTFGGFVQSINGNGTAYLGASSSAGLELANSGGSTSAKVNYDGSAEFSGEVYAKALVGDRADNSDAAIFLGRNNGSETSAIRANGNATFGAAIGQTVNCRPGMTGSGDAIWLQNPDNSRPFLVTAGGSATFAGNRVKINESGDYALETTTFAKIKGGVQVDRSGENRVNLGSADPAQSNKEAALQFTSDGTNFSYIYMDGGTRFGGEVVVTSRNQQWVLVEQGGLCHMVAATRSGVDPAFGVDEDPYSNLRNVFKELDMIESALQAVMEKLRMAPPAGWEVWDGST